MTAYEPGRRAVMKGRKDYWRGAPNLDSLEFIDLGSDSGALIAALASKQVDGLYEVDIAQLDAIKALPHIALYPVGTAQTGVARGRVTEKPFDDKRVRMALKLAIDTQKVADIVFRGNAEPAEHTHVAPVYPDYHAMPPMKQDIPRARALLAEAGHPNGIDVEIACKNQPAWESAVTTVMAEMWKEAGIRVKINVMPASAYWDVWMKIPFGFTTWTHRPLAVMTLGLAYRTGGGFNESGYSNPEFDRLLTEAEGTLDVDKRREIMGKLQTIMQEDGPIVQPIWRKVQTGYDKKVKGFRMHPSQYIFGEQLAVEA
jgi:peptide/nickel transport system substrate-binding protein